MDGRKWENGKIKAEYAQFPDHFPFIMLIGLPGSGKSRFARLLLAEYPQMHLISTDAIRAKLFGSEEIQGEWSYIWREIQIQLQTAISSGQGVIFDATNAQRRHRRELIDLARSFGFTHIVGICLSTPIWLCLARNQHRTRQVPEAVIFQMHHQLQGARPSLEEGFDQLIYLPQ